MKLFFLKFILLVALMFFSVLYGMQYANKGINTMRGYSPFSNEELSEQGIQAAIFGNDLADKKKQLEEIEAFNLFSTAGKKFSDTVTHITKEGLEKITELFNHDSTD